MRITLYDLGLRLFRLPETRAHTDPAHTSCNIDRLNPEETSESVVLPGNAVPRPMAEMDAKSWRRRLALVPGQEAHMIDGRHDLSNT
jgi:hypothetical protein